MIFLFLLFAVVYNTSWVTIVRYIIGKVHCVFSYYYEMFVKQNIYLQIIVAMT